jgi:formate hydrogenlyase subunit 3/multisubunit Na+/H+ antiporter MnhD subunit
LDITISLAGILISFSKIHDHSLAIISDYLFPVLPAMFVIVIVSYLFRSKDLRYYHGEGTKHSWLANAFFLSFLVISGMPVSSAFVSEDILLETLVEHRPILAVLTLLVMMMIGIILSKMYTRIFMGRPSF